MKNTRTITLENGAQYGAYIYVDRAKARGTSSYIIIKCAECGVEKEVRKHDFRLSTQRCFSCGYNPGQSKIDVQIREREARNPSRQTTKKVNGVDPERVYSLRTKTMRKIFDTYNTDNVCNVCGISEWMGEPLHMDVDHIIPIHRGGENKMSNLQRICPNCHRLKTKRENFGQPLVI